ncbi:uncharacterized isomerase BH0283-like isoform X3 [Zingiber officinale]|uniref:uncharacterized isomerase BH0283-like isoform X3 n=1 Tax=Zingiber officinale TaxID=94328 RepID=UPI001C4B574C|nr:uncharacterized isomerase BH0283-like isoform X3 [Zingiber officinale]
MPCPFKNLKYPKITGINQPDNGCQLEKIKTPLFFISFDLKLRLPSPCWFHGEESREIDAFTGRPFKGNPAAVCLLDAPEDAAAGDDWMQSVAKEFNAPVTAFLSRAVDVGSDGPTNGVAGPRFNIRWFTSVLEVELSSTKEILNLQPNFEEIQKCARGSLAVTAPAPAGSEFDFFTHYFCPKFGVYEDHVCGSVHCALAPYWSKKLGKNNLVAYMASPRSGRLDLELIAEARRICIRGEAVTVMTGTLLV